MIKERSRYHFVYQSILTQIEQGELSPGDSLPTARQLCQQYGVGITTIRRVLRMLQASQAISCVQGRPALVVGTARGPSARQRRALLGRARRDAAGSVHLRFPSISWSCP